MRAANARRGRRAWFLEVLGEFARVGRGRLSFFSLGVLFGRRIRAERDLVACRAARFKYYVAKRGLLYVSDLDLSLP